MWAGNDMCANYDARMVKIEFKENDFVKKIVPSDNSIWLSIHNPGNASKRRATKFLWQGDEDEITFSNWFSNQGSYFHYDGAVMQADGKWHVADQFTNDVNYVICERPIKNERFFFEMKEKLIAIDLRLIKLEMKDSKPCNNDE